MTEAIVAGAIAGAVAGAIAGLAVWLVTHGGLPRPGGVREYTHPVGGGWVASTRTSPRQAVGETRTHRGPFDRFNDRAKRTLALAQDEAIRFNHDFIGPEHLLLGLVREGEGVAARVLAGLGIELAKTRQAVENAIGRGESGTSPSETVLAPRTKKVIERATEESTKLGHHDIGTEHLLLGMIRDENDNACAILSALGAPPERIRHDVIAMLGRPEPPPTAG